MIFNVWRGPHLGLRGWCVGLGLASVMSVAAVASAWEPPSDPAAVFAARRDALISEGVRRVDGFVFASVRLPIAQPASERSRQAAEGKAGVRAVRAMLEFRIAEQLSDGIGAGGLRAAAIDAAVTCIEGTVSLAGLATVHSDIGTDSVQVVQAVPASALDAIKFDRGSLLPCLRSRAEAGSSSLVQSIVLYELDGTSSGAIDVNRGPMGAAMTRVLGPGFALALSGKWVTSEGAVEGMTGWTVPCSQAVLKSGAFGGTLSPLASDMLAQLTVDDLFTMLSCRVHDSSIQRALVERLRSSGFARTADFVQTQLPAVQLKSVVDRPGGQLSKELRAKVVASPIVVAALLADGRLDGNWSAEERPWYAPAVGEFNKQTSESLMSTIKLLADNLGAIPNVDAVSLLSATLIASDEPYLAEPLARAAFFAQPSHKFAGVNALRAAKALGLRERASELYPRVIAEAKVGEWGKGELVKVAEWLGVPAPTWASTDQSTKPVASDPVRTSPEGMDP